MTPVDETQEERPFDGDAAGKRMLLFLARVIVTLGLLYECYNYIWYGLFLIVLTPPWRQIRASVLGMDKPSLVMRGIALAAALTAAALYPDAGLLGLAIFCAGALIVGELRTFRHFLTGGKFMLKESPGRLFLRIRSGAVLLLAVLLTGAGIHAKLIVPRISGFYVWDDAIPAPGTLLRAEEIMADGVRAWRLLYSTTRDDNTPDVASAMLFAPEGGKDMPLVAWAHGTIGIVPHAAPSVALTLDRQMAAIPAFDAAVANGWAVVAPDYAGLGAGGRTHGYLIGTDEARSVLDAVRAAKTLEGLSLAAETVVWGHSQGGHAALWTGILAPSYAPELRLSGIAAAAPATDLPALLWASKTHFVGNALGAFALYAYEAAYPDVRAAELVKWQLRPVVWSIAHRSVEEPATLVSVVTAMAMRGYIYADLSDLRDSAYSARLAENIPGGLIAVPLFIAQGADDPLITRVIQDAFVTRQRESGQMLAYTVYPGDHMGVLDPANGFPADLAAWTKDVFTKSK